MILVPASQWMRPGLPLPGAKNRAMHLPVTRLYVHHSAGPTPLTPAGEVWLLQQYDEQHRAKGWDGLGYSFVIGPSGTVYEGRGAKVGAHTDGTNSTAFGVCFLGHFDAAVPTAAATVSFAELVRALRTPQASHGVPAGALTPDSLLLGHRDAVATACPGAALYAKLPELRALVDQAPAPKETSVPETTAPDYQINRDLDGRLVAGIAGFPDGSYLILGADGGVFAFGPPGSIARFWGRVHGQ